MNQLLDLAHRLAAEMAAERPNLEAILLAGSAAQGTADAYSDLDMMLYYSPLPTDAELEAMQAEARATGGNTYSYEPGQGLALYYFIEGIKVDMALSTTAEIEQLLETFWAEPPVNDDIIHLVVSGIARGKILHGAERIGPWQARLAHYPAGWGEALVRAHLRFTPRGVLSQMGAARGDYPLVYEQLLADSKNMLKVLCGLNQLYPPGKLKGLDGSLGRLKIAPADLAARWTNVWLLHPVEATAVWHDLVLDVLNLVDTHLPQVDTQPIRQRLEIPLRRAGG